MDYANYLRAVMILSLLLGCLTLLLWALKRFNLVQANMAPRGRVRRLAVVESLALDARRRVVLVRRDGVEHLLLLGAAGETVVEAGISPLDMRGDRREETSMLPVQA